MALRVLLADESSTIKKVMQLALQDFGIEVKSVPIGLDVLQVARQFMPDVIFADVLLSKKSGYEVAAEVKADPDLKTIPVILMWSGFMEIDEARARSSGAERRLEKPFDADHLRNLVKEVVPRLGQNQIADYLTFPDLPDIVETPVEHEPSYTRSRSNISLREPIKEEAILRSEYGLPPQNQAQTRQPPPQGSSMAQPPPQIRTPLPRDAQGSGQNPKGPPPQMPPRQNPPAAGPPQQRGPAQQGPPQQQGPPPNSAQNRPPQPQPPQSAGPRQQDPPPRAAQPPPQTPLRPPPVVEPVDESAFAGFVSLNPDLEDPDDFQQVPLPGSKTTNLFETRREDEDWRQGGLEQFRVTPQDAYNHAVSEHTYAQDFGTPDGMVDLTGASVAMTDGVENVGLDDLEELNLISPLDSGIDDLYHPQVPPPRQQAPSAKSAPPHRGQPPAPHQMPASQQASLGDSNYGTLDPMHAEEIIRQQVREVIENIAWKIIPDITERIVREEIQKLLREAERLS